MHPRTLHRLLLATTMVIGTSLISLTSADVMAQEPVVDVQQQQASGQADSVILDAPVIKMGDGDQDLPLVSMEGEDNDSSSESSSASNDPDADFDPAAMEEMLLQMFGGDKTAMDAFIEELEKGELDDEALQKMIPNFDPKHPMFAGMEDDGGAEGYEGDLNVPEMSEEDIARLMEQMGGAMGGAMGDEDTDGGEDGAQDEDVEGEDEDLAREEL